MTVLMTTHYMDEADAYCDRISLMHRSRIRVTSCLSMSLAGIALRPLDRLMGIAQAITMPLF